MNIQDNIIREKVSSRGGGVEINLEPYGFKGEKMAAYQNYLGGGRLGRICVNDSIRSQKGYSLTTKQEEKLDKIGNELMKYFHNLTNPNGEWESSTFEQNQNRAVSAY